VVLKLKRERKENNMDEELNKNELKQFIGSKRILGIIPSGKISVGGEIVEVKFLDGSSERMTKLMFDSIVSETETNLTLLRDKRLYPVVKEMLTLLLKWGVKIGETDYLFNITIESINRNIKKGEEKLWRKEKGDVTMFDLDDEIRKDEICK